MFVPLTSRKGSSLDRVGAASRVVRAVFLVFAAASVAYVLHGCNRDQTSRMDGSYESESSTTPGLNAAGGVCDNEVYLNQRLPFVGNGGRGGKIAITSSQGDVSISRGIMDTTPLTPDFSAAGGFEVLPGQEVEARGSYAVSWIRIHEGGKVMLADNSHFLVGGDVEVAGVIQSDNWESSIDGKDLTIDADGIVNITGIVNTSGFTKRETSIGKRDTYAGGTGGNIYITSEQTGIPSIYISGRILSDGGDTFAQTGTAARPGKGGNIIIGCKNATSPAGDISMAISGRVSARGGRCYFSASATGDGGSITLIALSDIKIRGANEFTVRGGDSSAATGGTGGEILLEAVNAANSISLQNLRVDASGGLGSYSISSVGGDGGSVTLITGTASLTDAVLTASGGDALKKDVGLIKNPESGGTGGNGGTVQVLAGSTTGVGTISASSAQILSRGGRSWYPGAGGGTGGGVKLINLNGLAPFAYTGSVSVIGGQDEVGGIGLTGTICVNNASAASEIRIAGSSMYPLAHCTQSDQDALRPHTDLACNEASSDYDSSYSMRMPLVTGVAFFRIYVSDAMKQGISPPRYLTITTEGSIDGDLDIYAGCEEDFGSTTWGNYACNNASSVGSKKTVCIDTNSIPSGRFIAVAVREVASFYEDFTISVGCSSTSCSLCVSPWPCTY